MATRHRIADAINQTQQGDVEKYFDEISSIIENNSGTNDYRIISSDAYAQSMPMRADNFTRFHLTETALDIIDISKGYINLKIKLNATLSMAGIHIASIGDKVNEANYLYYFLGFKSGAHIVNVYNVYSNGRLTACKNTKAKYEQAINYNCKAKEEKIARPGLYSPHQKVLEMSNCVCGTYIKFPVNSKLMTPQTQNIAFDVVIQVDDLLPFSAMSYYPRFLTGDLELEISPNITQNMVFCPIPVESSIFKSLYPQELKSNTLSEMITHDKTRTDFRFTQCGDHTTQCIEYLDIADDGAETVFHEVLHPTIIVSNLEVVEGKSYVHGFNIKDTAKQNIANKFRSQKFVIPAQWIEWYSLSQLPNTNNLKCNIQVPMFNATQIAFTFPNSSNQLTVSRNPHLESIQCHISDRIVPDKFFSTLDTAHSEMILNALGLDSLFSADDALIESMTVNRGKYNTHTVKRKDDSDYMLVINLERAGSGCFCDGMNGITIPINLQANFMEGVENPHYYRKKLNDIDGKEMIYSNVNLFVVSDAFWVFENGVWQFIKE